MFYEFDLIAVRYVFHSWHVWDGLQEFFEVAYKDLMLSTDKYQSINELPQETQEALDQLGLKSLILNVETSVANNKVSH